MNNNDVFYCPGCKSACKEGKLTCNIGATFYKQFKEGKSKEAAQNDEKTLENTVVETETPVISGTGSGEKPGKDSQMNQQVQGVPRAVGCVKPLSDQDIDRVGFNPFTRFRWHWALVSAGNDEKSNTMTVSWGCTGVVFGKDSVIVFVRDSRYTKEFMDEGDTFSLSFLNEKYKASLEFCGKYSGRGMDKWEKAALTPVFSDGTVYPKEANQAFLCRKVAAIPFREEYFTDPGIMGKWYKNNDLHTMYIGEIIKVLG